MNRLVREHNLVTHSVNTLIVGTWLYLHSTKQEDLNPKELDKYALGLLHDAGMSLPPFILQEAEVTTNRIRGQRNSARNVERSPRPHRPPQGRL